MAYTPQQMAILAAGFAGLPDNVKQLLNEEPIADTKEAIASLSADLRSASMSTLIGSMVTVTAPDRAALRSAAAVADGATLMQALVRFKAALASDSDPLSDGIAAAIAALKYYGI